MRNDILNKYNDIINKIMEYDSESTVDTLLQETNCDLYYAIDILKITLMRKVLNTAGEEQKFYSGIIEEVERI